MQIENVLKSSVIVMASVVALACAGADAEDNVVLPGSEFAERAAPSGPVCGAVACDTEFVIDLEQPAAWPLGTYEVLSRPVVGAPESCIIELGGPAGSDAAELCDTERFTVAYVSGGKPSMSSRRGGATSRDVELAAGGPAITSVHVDQPSLTLVSVSIIGPNGLVGLGSFVPEWGDYFYPNGTECSPSCRSAPSQTMALSWSGAVSE